MLPMAKSMGPFAADSRNMQDANCTALSTIIATCAERAIDALKRPVSCARLVPTGASSFRCLSQKREKKPAEKETGIADFAQEQATDKHYLRKDAELPRGGKGLC